MREIRTVQSSIFETYGAHAIGLELKAMSQWLDDNPQVLDWVAADVRTPDVEDTGRKGLPVESVLRCGILKQYRQLSYEELAFCLQDSAACQAFARLPMSCFPKKAALQETISAIGDVTWESKRINLTLLDSARQVRVEWGDATDR